ncbi:hypothetical protein [Nitrosococcus halophilus]|uniref:hypothetical protein n=1 Tax=Nitrosococcus halophilus TaxID=133539 RepID=UPI000311F967|nr:hypothetical protein [Nitrosococcus halophilus]
MSEGWGYEVTGTDVVEAYDLAMAAASELNDIDGVVDQIWKLIESNNSGSMQFVRSALHGRMRMRPPSN